MIVFYAISSNNTSSEQLLYVANSGANSITAYPLSAQGDIAPIRTIQGISTGLSHPVASTSDADGDLIVANALSSGSTSVETFADGASGNVAPIRSFMTSFGAAPGNALSVDPVDASIYLTDGVTVSVFSASGTLLRAINTVSFNEPFPGYFGDEVNGLAVDGSDDLIVGGDQTNKDGGGTQDDIFAPHASDGIQPMYYESPQTFSVSTIYAREANRIVSLAYDHVFALTHKRTGESLVLYDQLNAAQSPMIRKASVPSGSFISVDSAADFVFVGDSTAPNSILPFVGTATTFVPGSPIMGMNTGLSNPTSATVAIP